MSDWFNNIVFECRGKGKFFNWNNIFKVVWMIRDWFEKILISMFRKIGIYCIFEIV